METNALTKGKVLCSKVVKLRCNKDNIVYGVY